MKKGCLECGSKYNTQYGNVNKTNCGCGRDGKNCGGNCGCNDTNSSCSNYLDLNLPCNVCGPDVNSIFFRLLDNKQIGLTKGDDIITSINLQEFFINTKNYLISTMKVCPGEIKKISVDGIASHGKRKQEIEFCLGAFDNWLGIESINIEINGESVIIDILEVYIEQLKKLNLFNVLNEYLETLNNGSSTNPLDSFENLGDLLEFTDEYIDLFENFKADFLEIKDYMQSSSYSSDYDEFIEFCENIYSSSNDFGSSILGGIIDEYDNNKSSNDKITQELFEILNTTFFDIIKKLSSFNEIKNLIEDFKFVEFVKLLINALDENKEVKIVRYNNDNKCFVIKSKECGKYDVVEINIITDTSSSNFYNIKNEVIMTAERYPDLNHVKMIFGFVSYDTNKLNEQILEYINVSEYETYSSSSTIENINWNKANKILFLSGADDFCEEDENLIETVYIKNNQKCCFTINLITIV